MAEKSIDVLFTELSELKLEIERCLVTEHRLMIDDDYVFDSKVVKLHRMKILSIARSLSSLQSTIHHYLSMAEISLAVNRARDELFIAYYPDSEE